jgi:hypothetical protein
MKRALLAIASLAALFGAGYRIALRRADHPEESCKVCERRHG